MKYPLTARRATMAGAIAVLAAASLLVPTPAAAQTACGGFYTVRSGDSLLEIAQRCGVSIPALLARNPGVQDGEDLELGASLAIPAPGVPEPSPQEACGGFYSVRTGDTLTEIAEKCGLTVPLLVAANPSLPDRLGINVGLKVRIPAVPRAAVVAPTTFAAAAPAAMPAPAAAATPPAETPELIRFEGTLARGERCTLLRTADGTTIGLAGQLRTFNPGDRVVVLGLEEADGDCGTETTLDVRIAYRPSR